MSKYFYELAINCDHPDVGLIDKGKVKAQCAWCWKHGRIVEGTFVPLKKYSTKSFIKRFKERCLGVS